MPAPTEPAVPEPTPIEDDVKIAWGNGQSQHFASNTLEDEVQELQNEREFVTSNQNEDTVSDINETDEGTGVAEPEIPTEELDEYVELEQAPEQELPRYNLRQRKPWLQDADDYVTPQQKRPIVRRVYNNTTLRQAMEIRGALPAKDATKQELPQLVEKGCFRPIDKSEINSLRQSDQRILPSILKRQTQA